VLDYQTRWYLSIPKMRHDQISEYDEVYNLLYTWLADHIHLYDPSTGNTFFTWAVPQLNGMAKKLRDGRFPRTLFGHGLDRFVLYRASLEVMDTRPPLRDPVLREQIGRALRKLPKPERSLFVARVLKDMPYREMIERGLHTRYGVGRTTIATLCARAALFLKDQLS